MGSGVSKGPQIVPAEAAKHQRPVKVDTGIGTGANSTITSTSSAEQFASPLELPATPKGVSSVDARVDILANAPDRRDPVPASVHAAALANIEMLEEKMDLLETANALLMEELVSPRLLLPRSAVPSTGRHASVRASVVQRVFRRDVLL
jgi:hypothetical protein